MHIDTLGFRQVYKGFIDLGGDNDDQNHHDHGHGCILHYYVPIEDPCNDIHIDNYFDTYQCKKDTNVGGDGSVSVVEIDTIDKLDVCRKELKFQSCCHNRSRRSNNNNNDDDDDRNTYEYHDKKRN